MKIYRKREWKHGRLHSFIQLRLEPGELERLREARLFDMKVQLYAGSLIGKSVAVPALAQAFQVNLNRLRNRWSVAMVRTSGSVFIDILIVYIKAILLVIKLLWRVFFGGRKTVGSLLRGIRVSSKRVEDVKEAETFIFVSIAALHHALTFARIDTPEQEFEGDSFLREIAGLTFASAALEAPGAARNPYAADLAALGGEHAEEEFDQASADEDIFTAEQVEVVVDT